MSCRLLLAWALLGICGCSPAGCPVQLLRIEKVGTDASGDAVEGLQLAESGLELLAQQRAPLFLVPALGAYRGGKSMLLNRLQGLQAEYPGGFGVGHGQDTFTRGIYICPEEIEGLGTVVWMDTEGLFSPESALSGYDPKIFSLALLFSSAVLLNSVQVFNAGFFTFFDQQQQLARVLRQGLEKEGLPTAALLADNLTVFWVLQRPQEVGSSHRHLESLLSLKNEARERVKRDFQHVLHEVPTAVNDVDKWSTLDKLPDSQLRADYVAAGRSLREKVIDTLRQQLAGESFRSRSPASIAKQLKMYVQLVQTETFSGALAKDVFEETEAANLCDQYGRAAKALAGELPAPSLHVFFNQAREDIERQRVSIIENFHLDAKWSQRLEACLHSQRIDLERRNTELVLTRWKEEAAAIAEEGDCFFLGRLTQLRLSYQGNYSEVLGADFIKSAEEHASMLQRPKLVDCLTLRDFLWPVVPWLVGPVGCLYLRGGIASGIFNLALYVVVLAGLYHVAHSFNYLPAFMDVNQALLRNRPWLLDFVIWLPTWVPWSSAARGVGMIGGAWSSWKLLRCLQSIIWPGVHYDSRMAISGMTALELKMNPQLRRSKAAFRHQLASAALTASQQLETGSARGTARALLAGLILVRELCDEGEELFQSDLGHHVRDTLQTFHMNKVPKVAIPADRDSEGDHLVELVARGDAWDELVHEMLDLLIWLCDGGSGDRCTDSEKGWTPERTPSQARVASRDSGTPGERRCTPERTPSRPRTRLSPNPTSDAETPGSLFMSSKPSASPTPQRPSLPGSPGAGSVRRAWSPSTAAGESDCSGEAEEPLSGIEEFTFEPGDLGLDMRGRDVDSVDEDSQAARQGVMAGWVMLEIDEQPYTEQLLDEKIAGDHPYTIKFGTRDLPQTGAWGPRVQMLVALAAGVAITLGILSATVGAGLLPPPRGAEL